MAWNKGEGGERGLESLRIDPEAEAGNTRSSSVTAEQEERFFDKGRLEFNLERDRQALGWLGKLFGAHSQAPTNIAGAVIVLTFLLLAVSLFLPDNQKLSEARPLLLGLIGSALSFIFGAASKKD